ncbi:MAG TPA: LON peptidase substrate-binding domain-containing protein, partial [Candidatus Limnocylindria bacterium]|nr:LON peptidase substrate-binding domain-containing protein [Candidatus Limnocylindria bacterium]
MPVHQHPRSQTTQPKEPAGGQATAPKPRPLVLPVIVMDETVLLPHMSLPLPIEDDETAGAIEAAANSGRLVLLLTERPVRPDNGGDGDGAAPYDGAGIADLVGIVDDGGELPLAAAAAEPLELAETGAADDEYELCEVGVIAEVGQQITRPGSPTHVILQGVARGRVLDFGSGRGFPLASVERHDDPPERTPEAETAMTAVLEQVETYLGMLPNVPEEVLQMVRGVEEPGWLADLICFSPEFTGEQRQAMLEEFDPVARLKAVSVFIQRRLDVLLLRQQIQAEAQSGMDKQQREYYLREQLRAIQKELGEGSPEATLAEEMRAKIEAAGMPEPVKAKALAQAERLEQQPSHSPEVGIIRTYLEWLTELPWAVETADNLVLAHAARVLDEDHYGLEKVKERILEYIAVRRLAGAKMKAPILCFVGPP